MSVQTSNVYNKNIEKALQVVENNFMLDLSIKDLAHASGYSPFHFQRLFKHYTKETVHHYVCRLKLEKAAFMLKYQKSTISQVIDSIGFSCNSSFGRAFKHYFNICPKDFKEHFKDKFKSNDFPEFKIVNFDEKNVFFTRVYGDYEFSVPQSYNLLKEICKKNIGKNTQYISICYDEPTISVNKNKMRYEACIVANDEDIKKNQDLPVKVIGGGKYAKFSFNGTFTDFDIFYYLLYETFFHNDLYQISTKPAIQIHHNTFNELIKGNVNVDLLIPLD